MFIDARLVNRRTPAGCYVGIENELYRTLRHGAPLGRAPSMRRTSINIALLRSAVRKGSAFPGERFSSFLFRRATAARSHDGAMRTIAMLSERHSLSLEFGHYQKKAWPCPGGS